MKRNTSSCITMRVRVHLHLRYFIKISSMETNSCYILRHRWRERHMKRYARADSRSSSNFIFPKLVPPTSRQSLSRVINNSLSFVGFNAAATPHKAKLHPSWRTLSATFYASQGVAREKTSFETCTRNCFGMSLNQIPRFFRIGEHLRVFREVKLRSQSI